MGVASLRIYANFVTKPQADRICVLVCPSLSTPLIDLPSPVIMSSSPLSSDHWHDLIHTFQSVLYCPIGNVLPERVPSWNPSPLRNNSPQTRFRTVPCWSLLQALAISLIVMQTPLTLDGVLPRVHPEQWQTHRWQPSAWPKRWQLQSPHSQHTLHWQQLCNVINRFSAHSLVQTQQGNIYTPAQFCKVNQPQAGHLITLGLGSFNTC